MSSYTCENFQLFILYNFQFHHMMLKRLPEDLNSIFDFFSRGVVFFLRVLSCFFSKLLNSWYIRRKVEKRLSDLYVFFEFSSPFFVFLPFLLKQSMKIKFLGRGVLRDEFLHMWELSTFHSLQLSISSYDVKTTSRRPKLDFWLFFERRRFFSSCSFLFFFKIIK